MIEAEQAEDRGVQVVNIDAVSRHLATDFVGFTVVHAALNTATRHPAAVSLRPVVTTAIRIDATSRGRRTTEFSTPDDEGLVQETALLQVRNQSGRRGIHVSGRASGSGEDIGVVIPTTRIDLNEANAALYEATGTEKFRTEVALTIGIARLLRFFRNIKSVGRGEL